MSERYFNAFLGEMLYRYVVVNFILKNPTGSVASFVVILSLLR